MAALKLAGVQSRYCSTKSAEFPDVLRLPADFVIAAGGDGTVAKVIKNMPDREIPVAIVPLGTANNIARSVGISGAAHELSESWDLQDWRPFDVGVARGPWGLGNFVEAVGLGPLAKLMKKSKADALDGAARLAAGRLALRKELAKAEPMAAEIAIDDEPLAMEGMLAIEFVNTTYTGPGLPLPAAACPGDGMLGIICIGEREREAMLSWLEAPHTEPMPVIAARGRRIDFTWKGTPLRLDDRPIKGTREPRSGTVEIEIIPARLMAPHRSIDRG